MEPFYLEPGETILSVRAHPDGGYVVRIRTADGHETPHDIYPDQDAPEVFAWVRAQEVTP